MKKIIEKLANNYGEKYAKAAKNMIVACCAGLIGVALVAIMTVIYAVNGNQFTEAMQGFVTLGWTECFCCLAYVVGGSMVLDIYDTPKEK